MKYILTFLFIFTTSISFSQIQVGGGLGFGAEIEQPCITLKGVKDFTEEIDGSASLNFFFPQKVEFFDGEIKTSVWTINFDGHYIFSGTEKADIYGLAGINIAVLKVKSDYNDPFFGSFNTSASDSEFGLNIGAGGELMFNDQLTGFADIKYVISNFDQLVIVAGVLFNVGG